MEGKKIIAHFMYEGDKYSILEIEVNGKRQVKRFIEKELKKKYKDKKKYDKCLTKIKHYIMSLAEWGYENNEYFRYEGDGIWTFRLISCKIRIYFFILEDITNIFLATANLCLLISIVLCMLYFFLRIFFSQLYVLVCKYQL